MVKFDVSEFLRDFKDASEGLSGPERLAYLKGALRDVPEEFKDLITSLLELTKNNDSDVLVLIHGIRTPGVWQSTLESLCQKTIPNLSVVTVKYGFFDLVRFAIPLFRSGPIKRTIRELRVARDDSRTGRISVIAHSFGTYVISQILRKESDVNVFRLITCGSIIRPDFEWNMLPGNLSEKVINDVGCRDVLPVLAKSFTIGYGPSGFYGFGATKVQDRFHDLSHSGFFTDEFMENFWISALIDGTYKPSNHKRKDPNGFWAFMSLFAMCGWVYLAAIAGLIFLAFSWATSA